MRLSSVVLPAPLAPTIPTISPCSRRTLMSRHACTAPNWRLKLRVSNATIGCGSSGNHRRLLSGPPRCDAFVDSPEPFRHEQDDQQHGGAHGDMPGIWPVLGGVRLQKLVHNGPDHGGKDVAGPGK